MLADEPAVDDELRSGHEGRLVRQQEGHALGHLAWLAHPPEGRGFLMAEFGGDTPDEATDRARETQARIQRLSNAPPMKLFSDPGLQKKVWEVREAGLGATAFVPGEPDAWEGMTKIGGMEMPATVMGTVGLNEVVAHGWDLGRSTGQSFLPDENSIEGCLEFLVPMAQPGAENNRAPAFGPVVPVADDAPGLDRLVALTGRDPRWTPT